MVYIKKNPNKAVKPEPSQFIRKPEPGNKVKVYIDEHSSIAFGIVKEVRMNYGTIPNCIPGREVAILEQTKKVFHTNECDYCLPINKVVFV